MTRGSEELQIRRVQHVTNRSKRCLSHGAAKREVPIRNALHAHRSVDARTDEALAERAPSDLSAFAELYRRYRSPIHRYFASRTRDSATAEDLTAQVFFKALKSADGFRGRGAYRSWLFQIARNTLTSWSSEKERLQIPMAAVPEEPNDEDSSMIITLAQEESDLLWDTVEELSDAQREVIRLRYWKDLPIDEIARRTGRTTGAIRVLLHRSIHSLRTRLSGKDVTAIMGATGAAASFALYSLRRQRRNNS